MFSLLYVHSMLVLEFPMVKLDLLLCFDFLALVIDCLLHLLSEALLLFFHDFKLCLVSILELSESLSMPALLTC